MYQRLLFFWSTSFSLAVAGYYLLWWLLPGHQVFGALYRMPLYQNTQPVAYMAICCFFYGWLAAWQAHSFLRRGTAGRVGVVALLCGLIVLLSAPFGGMLWHWQDMQAGYFPARWQHVLLADGLRDGLRVGWLVVLASIPYAQLGVVGCYFLTRAGARLFAP